MSAAARKAALATADSQRPTNQGCRCQQQNRRSHRESHPASRQLQQGALAGGERPERIHHRDLMVELRVPQGDRGLVGEDQGQLPLGRPRKVGCLGFEEQHPEHALLVPQREVEGALDLIPLQIRGEEVDEQSLRIGGGLLPPAQVERLAPAGGPLRTGHQVAQLGILRVHLLLSGHRSDLAFALVVHRDGAAIEGEGTTCQVDHGSGALGRDPESP